MSCNIIDVANVQNVLYNFLKRTRSFTFFSILILANVIERKFLNLSYTICLKIYENIQHSMDIYDEIFIL